MHKKAEGFYGLSAGSLADDLAALKRLYHLPELNYIEISKNEALQNILHKWPILSDGLRQKQE